METIGQGVSVPIIQALAFPAAVYSADGGLKIANVQFQDLLERLMPTAALDGILDIDHLGRNLGLSFRGQRPDQTAEYTALAGQVAAFSVTPLPGGGWVLSAQDITDQRRAERSQKVAIIALADLAEHRDTDTGEHVLRVARLTHEIARRLAAAGHDPDTITDEFLRHVGLASILHDVGKVSVPDSILLKPGPLTAEERSVMERHAADGAVILRKAEAMLAGSVQFRLAADIAACHHERWNGTGYPHALRAGAIPLAARIVSVADVFDALISVRPYKAAWSQDRALFYLREQAGVSFDPRVVEALAGVLEARASARTIEWKASMEIGNSLIDTDHRILLALVNQISMPETKVDPIAVEFVLDELLGYTAMHFAREEGLMEKAGYPGLDDHRAIHKAMIFEVRQLQGRLVAFTPRLGDDLHRFLANWLMQHILVEDRRYIPYVC
jgi:hemerythrin-like metal-binding protein